MNKQTALLCMLLWCLATGSKAQLVAPTLAAASFNKILPLSKDSVLPVGQNWKDTKGNTPFQSNLVTLGSLVAGKKPVKATLGFSRQHRSIEVYYFPGQTDKRALIVGGVHGSELSSIEVVKTVIKELSSGIQPYYSVVIIPCLFPDNAAQAIAQAKEIGSTKNIGRYTTATTADPNRQMPPVSQAFNEAEPLDQVGRTIEYENQLLLQVIEAYRPQRIVNVHAIRNTARAGIFADPRTDCKGYALGYQSDSLLAIAMAQHIHAKGGHVPGNALDSQARALYHNDPLIAEKGQLQNRNSCGSRLNNQLGCGVSLGTWAATAVCDSVQLHKNRSAIRVITVEFPGNKRPVDYGVSERKEMEQQIQLYAAAISSIFLNNHCTEDEF